MGDVEDQAVVERVFSPLLWRFMLIIGVCIYSSYTILVHLCEIDGKIPFSSASMVLHTELLKLSICVVMQAREGYDRSLVLTPRFALPFAVPALLYFLNNNIAVHMQLEMDPATYQVLCNLKILSTAFLYRVIMKRPISGVQWMSLTLLGLAGASNSYGGLTLHHTTSSASVIHITLKGLLMISSYSFISGLSGVYTEYILKDRYECSIHVQNGLLYLFGVLLNGFTFSYNALYSGTKLDLYRGFSVYTWLLILSQAMIGLIMSAIMKHGNNITRLFLISCAMMVTTIMSILIFDLHLNLFFNLSFVLVLVALYMYHKS